MRMDISYASGWLGIFTYRIAPACRLPPWYATLHQPFQNWKTSQHRAPSSGSALHWCRGIVDSSVSSPRILFSFQSCRQREPQPGACQVAVTGCRQVRDARP